MKKQKERNINYKSLSANGYALLHFIKEKKLVVFGTQELHRLSGWRKTKVNNTLHLLKVKGHVVGIRRGKYATAEAVAENPYGVATEAVKPSYITQWTALSYYGFTEQQPAVIQLASPKQQKKTSSVEVTTLRPSRYYGYERVGNFVIAEKEKALVDSLHQPWKCGGLGEVVKCLKNAWNGINKEKFFNYLMRFNDKSMNSRVGYIMETLQLGRAPARLLAGKSKSYVRLDTTKPRTSRYDKRWGVMINRWID